MGSLFYWAKTDNFKEYHRIKKKYKSFFNMDKWFGVKIFDNLFQPDVEEPTIINEKKWFGLQVICS